MKWLLRIVGVLVLLVVIAAVVGISRINGILKDTVQTIGPEYTQSEVVLDGVNVSLLKGELALSGLTVGNPAGFATDNAFSLGSIRVNLDLASLNTDTVVVDTIQVVAPQITYEQSSKGNNLQALQRNIESVVGTGGEAQSSEAESSAGGKKLVIKDLRVVDGNIQYSNQLLAGKTLDLPLPEIHLTGIGEKSDGVTAGEVTKLILSEINKAAMGAVSKSDAIKDLASGAKDRLKEESGKLKGLLDGFRKKE